MSQERCFNLGIDEHSKKMCRWCPRRITLTPPEKRPRGWREEALAELHPLHICNFILRSPERTPLTVVEERDNERVYAQVKRQFYAGAK